MIEMNYDYYAAKKIDTTRTPQDFEITNDYSRYWHGNLVLLKPLLSLFTMKTIYNIHFVILSILFCILIFKLLQHSKLLAIAFTLSSISINLFLLANCTILINVFYIAIITSLILIKKYEKNDHNIDLVLLITGMLTAYFDVLSCETITITLPLFIYLFLHLKEEKRIDYKLIIKVVILWLLGFVIAFLAKWLLLTIHYNGSFVKKVIEPMKIRIYSGNNIFIDSLKASLNYFIPFANNKPKIIFLIVSTIILIINIILEKKNRITYLFLILISIIPITRYFALSLHVSVHNYFTYRAFLPIILLFIISDLLLIKNIKEIKIHS
jgi:hypothetical protein